MFIIRHDQLFNRARPGGGNKHQDLEYEMGALASRHGISVHEAREIIERCGADADAIEGEAQRRRTI